MGSGVWQEVGDEESTEHHVVELRDKAILGKILLHQTEVILVKKGRVIVMIGIGRMEVLSSQIFLVSPARQRLAVKLIT